MSPINFEDNTTEELKFIQLELDKLIAEYEKTYKAYIIKIRQQKKVMVIYIRLNSFKLY